MHMRQCSHSARATICSFLFSLHSFHFDRNANCILQFILLLSGAIIIGCQRRIDLFSFHSFLVSPRNQETQKQTKSSTNCRHMLATTTEEKWKFLNWKCFASNRFNKMLKQCTYGVLRVGIHIVEMCHLPFLRVRIFFTFESIDGMAFHFHRLANCLSPQQIHFEQLRLNAQFIFSAEMAVESLRWLDSIRTGSTQIREDILDAFQQHVPHFPNHPPFNPCCSRFDA